jgi:hypothetical protein
MRYNRSSHEGSIHSFFQRATRTATGTQRSRPVLRRGYDSSNIAMRLAFNDFNFRLQMNVEITHCGYNSYNSSLNHCQIHDINYHLKSFEERHIKKGSAISPKESPNVLSR